MNLLTATNIEVESAITVEINILKGCRDSYGDLDIKPSLTDIVKVIEGRHFPKHALRCNRIKRWKRGYPVKETLHITTKTLDSLSEELKKRKKLNTKFDKKLIEVKAAEEAGFPNVTAWKKDEREKKKIEKETLDKKIKEAAELKYKEDTSYWEPTVKAVLENRNYDLPFEYAIEKVIEKIDDNEGVGKAWNAGGNWEDNRFANHDDEHVRYTFVCCVLGAVHRHENTNYDWLLRYGGLEKDEARDLMEKPKEVTNNK